MLGQLLFTKNMDPIWINILISKHRTLLILYSRSAELLISNHCYSRYPRYPSDHQALPQADIYDYYYTESY